MYLKKVKVRGLALLDAMACRHEGGPSSMAMEHDYLIWWISHQFSWGIDQGPAMITKGLDNESQRYKDITHTHTLT